MKQNLKYFLWILPITMMIVIFLFSHSQGEKSQELSTGVTQKIVEKTIDMMNEQLVAQERTTLISKWSGYIRKMAHFFEYALLAISMSIVLYNAHRIRTYRLYVLAWTVCVLYACTDEIHQLYVPDRAGRVFDVFIDSLGTVFGLICFGLTMVAINAIWKNKETDLAKKE